MESEHIELLLPERANEYTTGLSQFKIPPVLWKWEQNTYWISEEHLGRVGWGAAMSNSLVSVDSTWGHAEF